MKPEHAVVKPRATAEAARDAHVRPTARTRHAVGNAGQRERAGADVQSDADSSSEWLDASGLASADGLSSKDKTR